jgi:choice-of-anchor A domain-containing protein
MAFMLRIARLFLASTSMLFTAATAVTAGPLGDFNVLVFGDFTASSSDVEGRLYASGNVSLSGYSVGDKISGALVGGDSLVVGGNLTYSSGAVYHGNIVAGGSTAGVASNVWWGSVNAGYSVTGNVASLPVDFAGELARFTDASAQIAGLNANGSATYQWGQLFLSGAGSTATQVFNITAEQFATASNIAMANVADGTNVIINVSGASVAKSGGGMDQFFERNRANVLFNFYEAETLSLGSFALNGSMLAVDAHVTTSWGVVWGQVVAGSWNGPMQVNDVPYEGPFPEPPQPPTPDTELPAPASIAVMLFGLAAMRRLRRLR